ncbi:MAG TPA: hypothetical protein VIB00_01140 [Pyrinomonadaceae bacterium]
MHRTKSVVCMLVLGLATSEAWAQRQPGTLRKVTLEEFRSAAPLR